MAKGLTKEIEEGRQKSAAEWDEANARAQRHPLIDRVNHQGERSTAEVTRRPVRSVGLASKSPAPPKVELPDVTGITIAVETPLKSRMTHLAANQGIHRSSMSRLDFSSRYRSHVCIAGKLVNAGVDELLLQLGKIEREKYESDQQVEQLQAEVEKLSAKLQREKHQLQRQREASFEIDARDRKGKRRADESAVITDDLQMLQERYNEVLGQKEGAMVVVE